MVRFIVSLLCCLLAGNTFALTIKSVIDNETVSAKISSLDVTRILVEGDRIKSVKGVKGAYTRQNDEKNGEVFIQPTAPFQSRAFTILIETELGRHFTLLLNPLAVPSDTLMLVPKGVGNVQAQKFETASDYELTVTHLIQAMTNNTVPEGYAIHEIDAKQKYKLGNIATLKLKTLYEGLHFKGEIYELCNTQSYPITLDEKSFYKTNTRAISLETINVPAYAKIKVLRVVNYD